MKQQPDKNAIYAVPREYYKQFYGELKANKVEVKTRKLLGGAIATETFSKERQIKLCSRITYPENMKNRPPEKYYVFEYPTPDEAERRAPKRQVVLETPEQVQTVLDYIKEHQKDGRTLQ